MITYETNENIESRFILSITSFFILLFLYATLIEETFGTIILSAIFISTIIIAKIRLSEPKIIKITEKHIKMIDSWKQETIIDIEDIEIIHVMETREKAPYHAYNYKTLLIQLKDSDQRIPTNIRTDKYLASEKKLRSSENNDDYKQIIRFLRKKKVKISHIHHKTLLEKDRIK